MTRSLLNLASTVCLGAKEYVDCFGITRGLAFLPLAKVQLHVKAREVAIPGHQLVSGKARDYRCIGFQHYLSKQAV